RAERVIREGAYQDIKQADQSTLYVASAPATLSEFQTWWDAAISLRVAYSTLDTAPEVKLWRLESGKWSEDDTVLQSSPLDIPATDVKDASDVHIISPVLSPIGDHDFLVVEMRMPGNVP